MKKIVASVLIIYLFIFSAHSQIFIDNSGNIRNVSGQGTLSRTNNNRMNSALNSRSPSAGRGFDRSRLVFGGNIGLQFGNYTLVNISPQVGYAFSDYITAGAGLGYTYLRNKYYVGNSRFENRASFLSFDLFTDVYPVHYIVLGVRPEISRMWRTLDSPSGRDSINKFVPSFLVGGGLCYGGITVRMLYDIIQDENSPYGNGIFYSIGYSFRF